MFYISVSIMGTSILVSNVLLVLHGYTRLTRNALFLGYKAGQFHAQGIQIEDNALLLHSWWAVSRKTTPTKMPLK